ncbi:selenocysteine-specific translation elongation factor [Sciscionella sediminilitoris]|uniref:selenocysteine-specific translation elongation factor n=1 Tax=Sciscionella sediminilitoris TaxID=1445613 RepID=UPI0004DEF3A7|nr:selenocysteine-specific translation elongation factor [Sciscionella sp. SE31]
MHVIATAGHVDHGKSTLLRALTGMEPDRWAEERRRGMTIDLGYVWMSLGGHDDLVFVDVPGHERFITNMLAGVGPVPATLLVVAADGGWSAQTEEHATVLQALGVEHGVIAVTRTDLAPAGPALAEVRRRLAGTSLAGAEAVAVSGITGAGLDTLRAALGRLVARMPSQPSSATRLWVDRVFTVRGAGTVVTGTLTGGTIGVGDELVLSPSGQPVRVKGMERLKQPVGYSSAVARVAVNLRGVSRDRVHRGAALLAPGRWAAVSTMDVRIDEGHRLPRTPMLHVGAAAVSVHLRPLGERTARLRLRHPLPIHTGERLILRAPGTREVAGAVALDIDPPRLNHRGAAAHRDVELAALTGAPDPATEVHRRGSVRVHRLVTSGIVEPDACVPDGVVAVSGWWVAPARWQGWTRELTRLVEQHARQRPLSPGLAPAIVARALGLPGRELLAPLVAACKDLVLDEHGVRSRTASPVLPAGAAEALERLYARMRRRPFAAPDQPELADAGLRTEHLAVAVYRGELLRIADGVYLLPDAPNEAARRLGTLDAPFTMSQARRVLDTSRRVAVPLLELLDRNRVTIRDHEDRRALTGRPYPVDPRP